MFVTHGGLGSLVEAIYHKAVIVGVPLRCKSDVILLSTVINVFTVTIKNLTYFELWSTDMLCHLSGTIWQVRRGSIFWKFEKFKKKLRKKFMLIFKLDPHNREYWHDNCHLPKNECTYFLALIPWWWEFVILNKCVHSSWGASWQHQAGNGRQSHGGQSGEDPQHLHG